MRNQQRQQIQETHTEMGLKDGLQHEWIVPRLGWRMILSGYSKLVRPVWMKPKGFLKAA